MLCPEKKNNLEVIKKQGQEDKKEKKDKEDTKQIWLIEKEHSWMSSNRWKKQQRIRTHEQE